MQNLLKLTNLHCSTTTIAFEIIVLTVAAYYKDMVLFNIIMTIVIMLVLPDVRSKSARFSSVTIATMGQLTNMYAKH